MLSQNLQRAVDGFQIATGTRWKLVLQSASIGISIVFAAIVLGFSMGFHYFREDFLRGIVACIVIGLAGGFIALVLRDLMALLATARR